MVESTISACAQRLAAQDMFTTGEIAKITGCAPRTVCQWIDKGILQGFRIPGGTDRRVVRNSLVDFFKANGMDAFLEGVVSRMYVATYDVALFNATQRALDSNRYLIERVNNQFELGALFGRHGSGTLFIDYGVGLEKAEELARNVAFSSQFSAPIIGLMSRADSKICDRSYLNEIAIKPLDFTALRNAVEEINRRARFASDLLKVKESKGE